MPAYLRLYAESDDTDHEPRAKPSIRVRLGDLFPLLASAHRDNYLWLNDFEDDEVIVTQDLYDVLAAFRAYRPSA